MLKKLVWIFMLILVIIIGAVAASYWFSPHISRAFLTHWLEQQGFDDIEFQMDPPSNNRLQVNHLALTRKDGQRHIGVRVDALTIEFHLAQLLQSQRVSAIRVGTLNVTVDIDSSLPERLESLQQETLDLHPQQINQLFTQIPADRLEVDQLNIRYQADTGPEFATQGRLNLDEQGLKSHWQLLLNQTALADAAFHFNRDASLYLHLSHTEKPLYTLAGTLRFFEEQWLLESGHQLFSQTIKHWMKDSLNISLPNPIGLQDPLSFTSRIQLPQYLPLDPKKMLDALVGDLTLSTQLKPLFSASDSTEWVINLLSQVQIDQRQIKGQLQLSTTENSGQFPSTQLVSDFRVADHYDSLTLNGQLSVEGFANLLRFSSTLASGKPTQVRWHLREIDAPALVTFLRPYVDSLPSALVLESGRFSASGQAQVIGSKWNLSGDTSLHNATLQHGNSRAEGIQWKSELRLDQHGHWRNTGELTFERLNIGLPVNLSPLTYAMQQQSGQLRLQSSAFTAELLGGKVYFPALNFDPTAPNLLFLVSLRQFDLGNILELYADKGLYGEGKIDGQLPIQLNAEGLRIEGGNVGTVAPGVIRYLPDEGLQSMAQANMGLGLALSALSDLHYELLDLDVHYQPNGDLLLRSRLQGNNPTWQQGRPIDLTISIEDNIPDLLRALQITGRITDAVDRHFQRSP